MKRCLMIASLFAHLPLTAFAGEFDQYLAPDTENANYVCEVPDFLGSKYYVDTESSEERPGEITSKLVIMRTRNVDSFNYVPLRTRFISATKVTGDRVQEKIVFQPPFDKVLFGVATLEIDELTKNASLSVAIGVDKDGAPGSTLVVYPKVRCEPNETY